MYQNLPAVILGQQCYKDGIQVTYIATINWRRVVAAYQMGHNKSMIILLYKSQSSLAEWLSHTLVSQYSKEGEQVAGEPEGVEDGSVTGLERRGGSAEERNISSYAGAARR